MYFLKFKSKEGFLELIEYLRQKNIPIAIISTHRQKDAKTYLSMCHLDQKVHYIIGSDKYCNDELNALCGAITSLFDLFGIKEDDEEEENT